MMIIISFDLAWQNTPSKTSWHYKGLCVWRVPKLSLTNTLRAIHFLFLFFFVSNKKKNMYRKNKERKRKRKKKRKKVEAGKTGDWNFSFGIDALTCSRARAHTQRKKERKKERKKKRKKKCKFQIFFSFLSYGI